MNPARSFGPALVAGQWDDFWVFVIAPPLGALVGGLSYALIRHAGVDAETEDGS